MRDQVWRASGPLPLVRPANSSPLGGPAQARRRLIGGTTAAERKPLQIERVSPDARPRRFCASCTVDVAGKKCACVRCSRIGGADGLDRLPHGMGDVGLSARASRSDPRSTCGRRDPDGTKRNQEPNSISSESCQSPRTAHAPCSDPATTLEFLPVGHAASEIIKAAREWPADLIVVGSHGRGGVDRVVLGSVAEAVVRRAPCPVRVKRAGA